MFIYERTTWDTEPYPGGHQKTGSSPTRLHTIYVNMYLSETQKWVKPFKSFLFMSYGCNFRGRLITSFVLGSMSVGLNILIRHSFKDL